MCGASSSSSAFFTNFASQPRACALLGVQSYPTVALFAAGRVMHYPASAPRTVDSLVAWLTAAVPTLADAPRIEFRLEPAPALASASGATEALPEWSTYSASDAAPRVHVLAGDTATHAAYSRLVQLGHWLVHLCVPSAQLCSPLLMWCAQTRALQV